MFYMFRSSQFEEGNVMAKDSNVATKSKDPLHSSWRKHMPDGDWIPDVSVMACMACKGEFSFWNRKHHCRRCGAVVCDSCSTSRTTHIHRDITETSEESARVCDPCIQVIDEYIATGLTKRFGGQASRDNNDDHEEDHHPNAYFTPQKVERNGRAVMTMGRYRAEIKESEGNRYIRDNDL
ncbi:hypothetical protein DYB28_005475 [Aphanomyces astaci]|uniref:FYVE-type domain-containing protein n=2 Tax=Aphanomyces astaci TaxID=112090 RepID=A0A397BMV8_APHAT|nr:hypothetical protein DYB36_000310 [Aphanomyces astaci]RHY49983.1 hypothetical protein DYB30_010920 [Aphanomyces astaci]RHY55350.1 hypothetical protein DYB34_000156 [Aphanomyces astaci]RLO05268.1 hypothetical protein DYB28_005475 [Aphanomyces astaci]